MLYSQKKERSNRFLTSIRIVFPFIFLLIFWIYTINKINIYDVIDLVLLILLTVFYVYYTLYMLYSGFKFSLISDTTGVFKHEIILKIIKKSFRKNENKNIVIIGIKNLNDIGQRYGFENANSIKKDFIIELNNFLEENNFKKVPIGDYSDGYFLLLVNGKINNLNHKFNIFRLKISKNGINNIELKVIFNIISNIYYKNLETIIPIFFYKMLNNKNTNQIKFETYEKSIQEAINNKQFDFKYQIIKSNKSTYDMFYVSKKLKIDIPQSIPKMKLIQIINKIGCELDYDKLALNSILNSNEFNLIKTKIFIEVSPVSIRNQNFELYIFKMIDDGILDPNKVVFEFFEDTFYEEIIKFKEIINKYKNVGFSFALSHFGGNNPSFTYLKYLNIDYIIYDMEFGKNFEELRYRYLFEYLNLMANKLGIKTIIRFVTNEDFYENMKKSNVDYVQGFYIDKIKGEK